MTSPKNSYYKFITKKFKYLTNLKYLFNEFYHNNNDRLFIYCIIKLYIN